MNLVNPVVFSTGPEDTRLASERGWHVVEREGLVLTLDGGPAIDIPVATLQIERGGLRPSTAALWSAVLDWLEEHVPSPLPVVGPNDYATELALWSASSRNWPVAALITGSTPVRSVQATALLSSCTAALFSDDDVRSRFSSSWPTHVPALPTDGTPISAASLPSPPPTRRGAGVTRVLVVAYFAGPHPPVAVQRVNYWLDSVEALSGGTVSIDVATACSWPDAPSGVHRVADLGPALLAPTSSGTEPWGEAFLANEEDRLYRNSRYPGGYWHLALERYFENREDEYDVVVSTGNPFGHFEFSRFAHHRWAAATVHDYRDPFALNPRFTMTPEARADAADVERGLNMLADAISVVNPAWIDYLCSAEPAQRVTVIPNGFDDSVPIPPAPTERPEGAVRLGHAGQFFPATPPDNLLRAMAIAGAEFTHVGLPLLETHGATVTQLGRRPRSEVLEALVGLDCGVAYVTQGRAEMPTKVFDYIASGLDILILHRGNEEATPLWDLLTGVAGVNWVHDDTESIAAFLEGYEPTRHREPSRREPFSRAHSTQQLIRLVQELRPAL